MTQLILASTSPARRLLLSQAGLSFEARQPEVDETNLKNNLTGSDPQTLASTLARAKAISVAKQSPDAIVIGADQVLNCDGKAFDKPETIEAAKQQLERLRGRQHWLETAICCAWKGEAAWHHLGRARLVMRQFSDDFLSRYLDELRLDVLTSVGGYKLEGLGVQLFDVVEGDYFTILGLPLLPLLGFLRSRGAVPS